MAPESETPLQPLDRLQTLFALLPAVVLAWPGPGSPLHGVFAATELTATGAALLATIPLAILFALRGAAARPRGFALLLVVLAFAFVRSSIGEVHDSMESERALMTLVVSVAFFLCGANLPIGAERLFLRGAMFTSLAFTTWALLDEPTTRLGGIVGNTGELSGAALFGAVAGALLSLRDRLAYRLLGGLTAVAYLWHAAAAPAIAGLLSFGSVLVLAALLSERSTSRRAALAGYVVVGAILFGALRPSSPPADFQTQGTIEASDAASEVDSAERATEQIYGGFGVRALIWQSTLSLIGEHALLGVGTGQFPVHFPRYRDPREIEASTLGYAPGFYMEVEHAHNDWLQAPAELGLLAGLALIALLAQIVWRSVRTLGDANSDTPVFAAATLAILVHAATNSTLLSNPAASTLAFFAAGYLLAGPRGAVRSGRAALIARAFPVLLFLVLVGNARRARDFVQHGRSLAEIQAAGSPSAGTYQRILNEAIAACPSSVVAHTLRAQLRGELGQPSDDVLREWNIVLDARPHRVQARMETARRSAILGDYDTAREHVEHVLELDPAHPTALRNLARFELYSGRLDAGKQKLEELRERGLFDETFGLTLGANLLLEGKAREGQLVLSYTDESLADLDGDRAWVEAGKRKSGGTSPIVDALESHAHRQWARGHAEAGNFRQAIPVYRQCLRITRSYVEGGGVRVNMELCAAMWREGRENDARALAAQLDPKIADWAAMPAWAGETLRSANLLQ